MKRVIVVGGSSGIGAAIAKKCHADGDEVLTMQRRQVDNDMHSVRLDLRWQSEAIREAFHIAASILGTVDWLVIAGGIGAYTQPLVDSKQIDEMVRTNYIGPRLLFGAALKTLRREASQPSSRVLYISSTIVEHPTKALEDYAASKAAGETFFRAASKRFAKWGIRSNVLRTGWIDTPMTQSIKPEIRERIRRASSLKRWGRPDEVGVLARDILAGPDYITGDILTMSGGI